MKTMWCWRCQAEVAMLDDDEWPPIAAAFEAGWRGLKAARMSAGEPSDQAAVAERFAPVLDEYERITGVRESNHLAVYHHRIALYGPPCLACGKPLRTPRARWCAACMTERA